MADLNENNSSTEGSSKNVFSMFGELPSGVQRVIIAVLVVLVLVGLVFIQRLIRTEEAVSAETDVIETVESLSGVGEPNAD